MDEFTERVKEICDIYIGASEAKQEGVHVYSTDEKMGIQAKEHKNPSIAFSIESGLILLT